MVAGALQQQHDRARGRPLQPTSLLFTLQLLLLCIRRLVCFMVYNAFPMDDVDSWEGSIKSLGRMCCFDAMLSGSAAVGGK